MITMEEVGKSVSEDGRSPAEIDRIAAGRPTCSAPISIG